MYTKEQIIERIAYLKSISSSSGGYGSLFQALEEAVESYFTRDDEFKKQARETFKRVKLEIFFRSFKCDRMDLLPSMSSPEYPVGYLDVMHIFNTSVFDELLTIDDNTFRAAFYTTQSSEDGGGQGSSSVEYHNTYIEKWVEEITSTIVDELVKLKTLEDFCYAAGEKREDSMLFEELGSVKSEWGGNRKGYAHVVYIQKEWDNFNTMFDVGIYEPSYINELRNGDYSDIKTLTL